MYIKSNTKVWIPCIKYNFELNHLIPTMQVTFHLMNCNYCTQSKVYVAFVLLTYNICSGPWNPYWELKATHEHNRVGVCCLWSYIYKCPLLKTTTTPYMDSKQRLWDCAALCWYGNRDKSLLCFDFEVDQNTLLNAPISIIIPRENEGI